MRFPSSSLAVALSLTLGALAGCSGGSSPPPPPGDPYLYTSPPTTPPPAPLDPVIWTAHHRDDLLPYWTSNVALGAPVGNFPTWRQMDGAAAANTARKPRMMGRQIYAYAMGYLLSGDETLLGHALEGQRWLLDHARDATNGGWHADLDAAGNPSGAGIRWSQDLAYDVMGPAAWFFVTRDPEAEAVVLAARDQLFDPARFWDASNGRIRDGLDAAMSAEQWMSGTAGDWQLVAQLDPVTAFELLVQPVLTDPARRSQALGDLRTLATLVKTRFWQDGLFWGSTMTLGAYGSNHSDFGHILKAYWALLLIDKRLDDRPLASFLSTHAPATLAKAFDAASARWAKVPTGPTTVAYGSDWWAYAEADQLAGTLLLHDPGWIPTLGLTSVGFLDKYVDRSRPAREVVSSIKRDGTGYGWLDTDTAKCNEWKNGFHSTEHALVMFLVSHYLANTPAPLYFAFSGDATQIEALARASRPYTFQGRYVSHADLGPIAGDTAGRHKVKVLFDQLR